MVNTKYSIWSLTCSLWLCTLWTGVQMQTCTKINSCSCSYGANQVIDLSPLEGNPKWADQYDSQFLNMYSYNPCKSFSEGTCKDVAVCQFNSADYFECGTQESSTFTNDPLTGALILSYSSTDGTGFTRTSQVTLTCAVGGVDTLTVGGETTAGTYIFTLASPHCCPKAGPSGGGTSSGGLSIGSILVIGFVALSCVYLFAGISFQHFARKAAGKDKMPNVSFWTALPGLVKDGTLFVVKRGNRQGYSSV